MERKIHVESVDDRLLLIQKAVPKAQDGKTVVNAYEALPESVLALPRLEAPGIDSLQPLKSSRRRKTGLEPRPIRSSATWQEQASQIVSKVLEDVHSLLTNGHNNIFDMSKRINPIPEIME